MYKNTSTSHATFTPYISHLLPNYFLSPTQILRSVFLDFRSSYWLDIQFNAFQNCENFYLATPSFLHCTYLSCSLEQLSLDPVNFLLRHLCMVSPTNSPLSTAVLLLQYVFLSVSIVTCLNCNWSQL